MAGVRKYGNPEKPKRQRKRKARTEVSDSSSSDSSSSSSSSESEDGSDSEPTPKRNTSVKAKAKTAVRAKKSPSRSCSPEQDKTNASPSNAAQIAETEAQEDAFTSFYLRQMTTEFAEDLDKIRSAGDFNDKSLGLLISALKQGRDCFDRQDRLAVGKAIVAASQ